MLPTLRTLVFAPLAVVLAAGCVPTAAAATGDHEAATPQTPPKLVVLLVVDQLPDYLVERFDPAFTGGFRRLLDGGFRFRNATHDHANTETSPGHATIATGTEPAKHGVPANDWWERIDGQMRLVLNVVDPGTPLVDDESFPGASPAVLRRSTLAEWMQAADEDTRVVSVSGKPRGAVLLAGHADAEVYWFDETVGRFVTSVHYRDDYPRWVDRFNDEALPRVQADSVWELSVDESLRSLARPDSFPWEGDAVHTAFPHALADGAENSPDRSFWIWYAGTPGVDSLTLELALEAVAAEDLGEDDVPDLLAVSLSQTDRIGHGYGPTSLEQLDNLIRLDRELAAFFDRLDERVGPEGWVVAMTSDHGAVEMPEFRAAQGMPGVRLNQDSVASLQRVVDRVSGETDFDLRAVKLAEGAATVSWIARAWTHEELAGQVAQTDSFARLEKSNFVPGRMSGLLSRAGVQMQFAEGVLSWAYPVGSGHGSPYLYDRHVPLVFYGAGVNPGTSDDAVSIADLAPTLAAFLGVPAPDDVDGVARPIR